MRIAIVTRHLPPRVGGVSDYASQFAYILATYGIAVIHLTSSGPATPLSHPSIRVCPIVRRWGWFGVTHLILSIRELNVQVINFQYVPHMYGRYGANLTMALFPLLVRLGTGRPVVTTCHEILYHTPSDLKMWLSQAIYLFQACLILLGSSKVIVPTAWQEIRLRRCYPWLSKKVFRIPVGNNIPVVPMAGHPQAPYSHRAQQLTLGTFGMRQSCQQYKMVMKVLKGLLNPGLKINLLCIGDLHGYNPDLYRHLRQYEVEQELSGLIRWTGLISAEEISHHLRSIDIFLALNQSGVSASNSSLIAALAHGLPIIATRGPDTDEWLLKTEAMAFVDPYDLPGVLRAAKTLAMDPLSRRKLGEQSLTLYRNHFSWDTIRCQFLQLISPTSKIGIPLWPLTKNEG